MSPRERGHLIAVALLPTIIFWLVALLFAFWRDATWPDTGDNWITFVLICVLIEFFLLKALLMTRRMIGVVLLTASLIVSNAMLAVIFSFQQALALWPTFFFVKHLDATTWVIRGLEAVLCAALLWTIWELANVPPPAPLDEEIEEPTP
jgi:lysylphosphatidylglycerol synthetase-like protein (DUF2156 family)